jgi:competence protein ComEC
VNPLAAYPFLRMLLPLACGIALHGFYPQAFSRIGIQNTAGTWLVFPVLAVAFLLFSAFWRGRAIGNVFTYLALVSAGITAALWHTETRKSDHYLHMQKARRLQVLVRDAVPGNGTYRRLETEVLRVEDSSGRVQQASGHLLVYLAKADSLQVLPGDIMLVPAALKEIPGPALPGMFDFRSWMLARGYARQVYVNHNQCQWQEKAHDLRSALAGISIRVRQLIHSHLKPEAAGLLESVLLGYRRDISREDREAFAKTGTLHVLAVSGLHVGIIYAILLWLSTVILGKSRPLLRVASITAVLWTYALLTGLSPSVTRAVLMFSIMLLGMAFKQHNISLNTLCAAGFLMLCFYPAWLFEAGFLLSFTAVAGILLFYPVMEGWWQPKRKIFRFIWQLLLVTLAAQLGTLAVSLYAFHQFPVWFLPSNLVVIPAITLFLILGLLALSVGWIPFVGAACWALLDGFGHALLQLVRMMAALPHATVPIYIGMTAAGLVFLICGGLYWWWSNLNTRRPWLMLAASLLLLVHLAYRDYGITTAQTETYLSMYRNTPVVVLAGRGEALIAGYNMQPSGLDSLEKQLENWLRRNKVQRVAKTSLTDGQSLTGQSYRLQAGEILDLPYARLHFRYGPQRYRTEGVDAAIQVPLNRQGQHEIMADTICLQVLLFERLSRYYTSGECHTFVRIPPGYFNLAEGVAKF